MSLEEFQVPLQIPTAIRLDKYLAEMSHYSRSQIQQLIDEQKLFCDGQIVKRKHKIRGGERITFETPQAPPTSIVAENLNLDIPYVHDDFLIVNKNTGMVVHPGKGNWTGTLANGIVHYIQEDCGEALRPGIVHRIDKGTSGLLVVARNPQSLQHFQNLFVTHDIQRTYYALVWGVPQESGTITNFLGRHPKDRTRYCVLEEGKLATTHYKRCAVGMMDREKVSLLRCQLETGRTHQIRVHMSHLGYPIVGDPVYGKQRKIPKLVQNIEHQLLHAFSLGFVDRHKKSFYFEQEFPRLFCEILERLQIPIPIPEHLKTLIP